jgi:two-component system, sensor histidine kinase and response regulator
MNYNILSVDEIGTTRIELASILKNLNINIINVKDEFETINTLRGQKDLHAIIWTINSIDLKDYDVIKRLKSREEYKNIPVIIVSRFTDKKYIIKAIEAGATEFIAKPYDKDTVVKKIGRILGISIEKTMDKSPEEDIVVFNFSEMLSKEIKSASRGGYEMSIMMVSVTQDNSIVNAKDISEELVALINKIIKVRLRETDTIFSYGTNNLVILLPFAGNEGSMVVEEKVKDVFLNHSLIKQKNTDNYSLITASVSFPCDGKIKDKLLEKLEKKLSENMKKKSTV